MSSESAFGRPARWSAALPAIAVGCVALFIALYGRWRLPPTLPEMYRQHLNASATEYAAAEKTSGMLGNGRLIDAAGQRDVIFGRLASLESASSERYWQWAMFLIEHATLVRNRVNDPAASIQPLVQERLLTQAEQFEGKSRDILEQLAAGSSPQRAPALLRVTRDKFKSGLALFGLARAAELADNLAAVVVPPATEVNSSQAAASLEPEELIEAQNLLVQLKIEAAWQANPTRRLVYDAARIDEAVGLLNRLAQDSERVEWQALRQLLQAYASSKTADAADSDEQALLEVSISSFDKPTWQQRQAALYSACVRGNWSDAEYLMSSFQMTEEPAVAIGTCRTICRLAVSPLAQRSPAWSEKYEAGLMLVVQRASHLPELAELMWACASEVHNSTAVEIRGELSTESNTEEHHRSDINLAVGVKQSLTTGSNVLIRQTAATLNAALAGDVARVRRELEPLKPGRGSCFLIARTVLWRTQNMDPEAIDRDELQRLLDLFDIITQAEPEGGLNWLVLAALQLLAERPLDALTSLDQSEQRLGAIPLIAEYRKAAQAHEP